VKGVGIVFGMVMCRLVIRLLLDLQNNNQLVRMPTFLTPMAKSVLIDNFGSIESRVNSEI
jgi:hypothetical protein